MLNRKKSPNRYLVLITPMMMRWWRGSHKFRNWLGPYAWLRRETTTKILKFTSAQYISIPEEYKFIGEGELFLLEDEILENGAQIRVFGRESWTTLLECDTLYMDGTFSIVPPQFK